MPVTEEQRNEILRLETRMDYKQIAAKLGIPPGTVAAVKAVAHRNHSPMVDQEITEAIETKFGLEHDLQRALRKNIDQLEHGLTIVDGNKELKVPSGFIDITAEDKHGATVVIELKAGAADREAVAQILAYMGDLLLKKQSVRGILVAGDFPARTIAAARVVPNLELRKYGFKFSFETVAD